MLIDTHELFDELKDCREIHTFYLLFVVCRTVANFCSICEWSSLIHSHTRTQGHIHLLSVQLHNILVVVEIVNFFSFLLFGLMQFDSLHFFFHLAIRTGHEQQLHKRTNKMKKLWGITHTNWQQFWFFFSLFFGVLFGFIFVEKLKRNEQHWCVYYGYGTTTTTTTSTAVVSTITMHTHRDTSTQCTEHTRTRKRERERNENEINAHTKKLSVKRRNECMRNMLSQRDTRTHARTRVREHTRNMELEY